MFDQYEYLTLKETALLLRVSVQTLRRRMRSTPESLKRPWVTLGNARRPTYRFNKTKIGDWWEAVNQR